MVEHRELCQRCDSGYPFADEQDTLPSGRTLLFWLNPEEPGRWSLAGAIREQAYTKAVSFGGSGYLACRFIPPFLYAQSAAA